MKACIVRVRVVHICGEEQDGGGWRRRKELTFGFLVRGANAGAVEGAMSLVQSNLLIT